MARDDLADSLRDALCLHDREGRPIPPELVRRAVSELTENIGRPGAELSDGYTAAIKILEGRMTEMIEVLNK